jgi:cytoskeletal protein CcmA (bactofilin family)
MTLAGAISLNGSTLTLQPYATTLSGSINGTGSLIVSGNGLNVTGSIAISGSVTAPSLNVSGSITASLLSVNQFLSGNGTLPATSLSSSATLRVGNDSGAGCCGDPQTRGTLTTGNVSAAGTMAFDLVTPTPGSGHDQLAVNGTVTLNNPTLQISFPGVPPAAGQSFVLIANDGTDAISGTFAGLPEGSSVVVGATSIQITYAGGTGNDVVATIASGPKSWTGAVSNLWSVGGNWNGGVAPVNGDALVFPVGASNINTLNDLTGLTLATISLSGSVPYTLAGNAITLNGGMTSPCCGGGTWSLPTTLGASQTFAPGTMTLAGPISLNGSTLTLQPYATTLSGSINGTGSLIVSGNGLNVAGSIAISGNVTAPSLNVSGSITASLLSVNQFLSGNGTLPATSLSSSATLRVGNDSGAACCGDPQTRGILTTGNVSATAGTMAFDLVTPTPGSGHDQLAVNGTVTLNNPTLQISFPGIPPAAGQSFVLIANDGTDAISGTFAGLPEGRAFTAGAVWFRVGYAGGTGNDAVVKTLFDSSVSLISSKNPTVSGQTFTLTAHIASTGGTPTGSVSFEEGSTIFGVSPLNGSGDATLSLALPAGAHSVIARYLGEGIFAPGVSAAFGQSVDRGMTAVTLTTTPNPASSGNPITATIHVSVLAPSSGIPTGSASVSIDGNLVASGTLDVSGALTLSLPGVSRGTHQITVTYSGDTQFLGSSSAPADLVVLAADIPALGEWMILLLAIALAIVGWTTIKKL